MSKGDNNDFFDNPISAGDFVYRNEKLHKVVAIAKPDEWGYARIKVHCIHPYKWKAPKILSTRQFVIIPTEQLTMFFLKHGVEA